MPNRIALALWIAILGSNAAWAAPVPIVNPSFELDPENFNEFYFGDPTGWTLIDDFNVVGGGLDTDVQGTLEVTGSPYFGGVAPDGDNVAILFIGGDVGAGEVGLGQVLSTNLAPNTHYTLSVEVGDIESGLTESGAFFDLRGFPGYRIELLAGGVLLDFIEEGIDAGIGDGNFVQRSINYTSGASHVAMGAPLEIRLFNLNLIDPTYPGVDLEVDFDSITLDATAVPLPPSLAMLVPAMLILLLRGRRPNSNR